MSERCLEDVQQFETRSKRKPDQPTHDGCGSERNSEQELTHSPSGSTSKIRKGSIPAKISRDQLVKNNLFEKKFSYEDEKKILKALHKTRYNSATTDFWNKVGDSLKLSFPVEQKQVYEKARRLKENYNKKRLKLKTRNGNHAMSKEESRLFRLSDKIWGEAAQKLEEEREEEEEYGDRVDEKLEKFVAALRKCDVNFPVAEALKLVTDGSKRSNLEKKWKDSDALMIRLYNRRIKLIKETMAAASS